MAGLLSVFNNQNGYILPKQYNIDLFRNSLLFQREKVNVPDNDGGEEYIYYVLDKENNLIAAIHRNCICI